MCKNRSLDIVVCGKLTRWSPNWVHRRWRSWTWVSTFAELATSQLNMIRYEHDVSNVDPRAISIHSNGSRFPLRKRMVILIIESSEGRRTLKISSDVVFFSALVTMLTSKGVSAAVFSRSLPKYSSKRWNLEI